MDGNVQRRSSRSSSLAQFSFHDEDDSDTISLTSTVESEHASDSEFDVEDVHDEAQQEINGQLQTVYFVEWANFPLDQCTWEPLKNLPVQLMRQWEEKKATQDPSVFREFEEKYTAAFNARLEEARQRHRRRNAKRKRLGRPMTPFWFRGHEQPDSENDTGWEEELPGSDAESFAPSSVDNKECDEADEDNAVDHRAWEALESTESSSRARLSKPDRPPSRIFTLDHDNANTSAPSRSRERTLSKGSQDATRSSIARELRKTQSSKRLDADHETSRPTGYQGSARMPSTAKTLSSHSADASNLKAAAQVSAAVSAHIPAPTGPTVSASPEVAKTLTGKKTSQSTMPVDVFSGGKKPRERQGMGAIEVDNKHAPKIYKMASHRRKAEMRSRDREDLAPDIIKIPPNIVFIPGLSAEVPQSAPHRQGSISVSDSTGRTSKAAEAPPSPLSTTLSSRSGGASGATAGAQDAGPPKRGCLSSVVADRNRPSKKVKQVHFTEVESGPSVSHGPSGLQRSRSERFRKADDKWIHRREDSSTVAGEAGLFANQPTDIDSSSGFSPDQPADAPNSSTAGTSTWSLSTYLQSRNIQSVQSVDKKIKLSTSGESILDVTFNAVPNAVSLSLARHWLNDFLNMSCLDIGHMVLAETLIAQLPSLSSSGFQPLCSGTISSTRNSKDLETIAENLRIGSLGLFMAQAQFNLLVFPAKCADFDGLGNFGVEPVSPGSVALKYFMFKSALPIFQHIRPLSSTIQRLETRMDEEKVVLFPTILGIQYSALIATADKDKKKPDHFFLAFPQRSLEWQQSIASWLSTRQRNCKIYTKSAPGSWLAFVEKAKRERGVVIVHEALVHSLRRFPQLAKLLVKYPVSIWRFSECLDLGPPRTLLGSKIVPAMSTKLSRLFPVGSVVLVTPSFLVSEPQAAYRLFNWFFTVRVKQGNHKLMAAHNITEYLSELSSQKTALRSKLQDTLWMWKHKNPMDIAMDKNKAALTDQDLEARQKTWLYMDWWLSDQVHGQIPFSDFNPAFFVDRSIDPHDEQSLVNWFGWWSMEHSHEYRKFYVLGSSSTKGGDIVHTVTSRTSRKVPLARYSTSTVNDPDEALRIALSRQALQKTADFGFQSQCFHNDEKLIGPWLETQDSSYSAKVYRSPVSWVDKTMAVHFGDPGMSFKTIGQWWDSLVPWTSGSRQYNTFIGFFYTISEEWDPNNKPPNSNKPRRHPWLAIWRPVEPHQKGTFYAHGRTELIIWDVRAGAELETKASLQLTDLTWMQQALIKHIQLHAGEKNPDSFLERVWLGGFQAHQSPFVSTEPADITAEFLVRLTVSLNHTLAAAAKYLLQSGFRQVTLRAGTGPFGMHDNEERDEADADADADTRIIFHPPRGSGGLQSKGTSKCINELFEATRLERLRFKHAKEMVYTYAPTLSWYRKQVAEGRHFEHVLVDEWDKIFSVMGVDK